jgi:hypothetical protein
LAEEAFELGTALDQVIAAGIEHDDNVVARPDGCLAKPPALAE